MKAYERANGGPTEIPRRRGVVGTPAPVAIVRHCLCIMPDTNLSRREERVLLRSEGEPIVASETRPREEVVALLRFFFFCKSAPA